MRKQLTLKPRSFNHSIPHVSCRISGFLAVTSQGLLTWLASSSAFDNVVTQTFPVPPPPLPTVRHHRLGHLREPDRKKPAGRPEVPADARGGPTRGARSLFHGG